VLVSQTVGLRLFRTSDMPNLPFATVKCSWKKFTFEQLSSGSGRADSNMRPVRGDSVTLPYKTGWLVISRVLPAKGRIFVKTKLGREEELDPSETYYIKSRRRYRPDTRSSNTN
jgi:hypothetical protein